MADAVAGLSGRLAVGMLGPRPSVKIITFKLGALEIVLRGVAVVLSLCDIIAASLALDDINNKENRNIDVNLSVRYYPGYDWNWGQVMEASKGVCGTLIFLSLLIVIIEGLVIAQRFLNVGLVEKCNQAFIIADALTSGVMAFLFLGLAVGALVCTLKFTVLENKLVEYSKAAIRFYHVDAKYDANVFPIGQLNDDMAAVSAFCGVSLLVFAMLTVFMSVSLKMGWRNSQVKYIATHIPLVEEEEEDDSGEWLQEQQQQQRPENEEEEEEEEEEDEWERERVEEEGGEGRL